MPLTVSYQVGAGQPISVTFGLTNVRAKALLERYARRHGLVLEGMTDAQIVEAIIRFSTKQMAIESANTQKIEAVQAQEATVDAAVASDNDLLAP